MTRKAEPKPAKQSAVQIETVTLDQLAKEMKMPARDARMVLRLAAKQTKRYPNLAKAHEPRQPWQWAPGSKALEEAREALSNPVEM